LKAFNFNYEMKFFQLNLEKYRSFYSKINDR
jgi:hypothetical protein